MDHRGFDPASSYYDHGGIASIDIIRAKLTPDQFKGWLLGNMIKYTIRAQHKGQLARDLEKLGFYQQIFMEVLDEEDRNKLQTAYPGVESAGRQTARAGSCTLGVTKGPI